MIIVAQVLDSFNPSLSEFDTNNYQNKAKIKLPKKSVFNYFYLNIPMNPSLEPKEKYPYPILSDVNYSLLYCFKVLAMSKSCHNCGEMILPKQSDNMKVPSLCKKCKSLPIKPQSMTRQTDDIQRSSVIQRLSVLLDSIFIKYHLNSELHEDYDYTQRWHSEQNKEIYLTWTIDKDAVEVISCIDALIAFNRWPSRYYVFNGKSHRQLFDDILNNNGILKFEPFYKLIIMCSSIVKGKTQITNPMLRYPRTSPANVVNVDQMQRKPNVDQKTFE